MLGWGGGRADHLLSVFGAYADPKYAGIAGKLALVDAHNEVRAFIADGGKSWELPPNPRFRYVGFYAATALRGIALSGFKYELRATDAPAGKCWTSNEFLPGVKARLTLAAGVALAIYSVG